MYDTIREYAREAAKTNAVDWTVPLSQHRVAGADSASDIWEPIVRTLLFCLDSAGIHRELLDRIIKETLDMTVEAQNYNAGN